MDINGAKALAARIAENDRQRWIVLDDFGVIASGTEDEAREAYADPGTPWHGDLVLAQVVEVRR